MLEAYNKSDATSKIVKPYSGLSLILAPQLRKMFALDRRGFTLVSMPDPSKEKKNLCEANILHVLDFFC